MVTLPYYEEWWAHGAVEHMRHDDPHENCAGCIASIWLPAIRHLVMHDDTASGIAWDLQDGYGVAGYTPAQGWDWSGIRDSSPATVRDIAVALGLHNN